MIILVLFSFLAGIVTILSPCILPVLPIILSGSLTGGNRRPLGIILGFIISFTFFTLFLTTLVRHFGFSANLLRSIAVLTVLIFGISMLAPFTQILLEKIFSKLSGLITRNPNSNQNKTGFIGGIFLGATLGLIWTPCVGPILASVITLAATAQINFISLSITLAYSLGTAIPLFMITIGGRQLLQKHKWLLKNSAHIQKMFGVFMILTAIAIYLNVDRSFQAYVLQKFPNYGIGLTVFEDNATVRDALLQLKTSPMPEKDRGKPLFDMLKNNKAPSLIPGGAWFNVPLCAQGDACDPVSTLQLKGKVVLIDFWTYTCINCIRTLPYLKSWYEKYHDKGFTIIGVHTPEFEFEKDFANVEKAIFDFGIKYPVMQDNDFATWKAFDNHYWPAKYLIDKDGTIRYTHFGEGDYDETERRIQELLAETGTTINQTVNNPDYDTQSHTPELYVGTKRFVNGSMIFRGDWQHELEHAAPTTNGNNYLELDFNAKEVFVVARPKIPGTKSPFSVHLKGEVDPNAYLYLGEDVDTSTNYVWVDSDRLYKLINLPIPGKYKLILEFPDNNIELYAFTFG